MKKIKIIFKQTVPLRIKSLETIWPLCRSVGPRAVTASLVCLLLPYGLRKTDVEENYILLSDILYYTLKLHF